MEVPLKGGLGGCPAVGAPKQGWDFGARFVKIEPFVHTHFQQLNALELRGFPLGHSLGPNADRKSLRFRKWLPGRGWLAATVSWTRKGLNPIDADGEVVENVGGAASSSAPATSYATSPRGPVYPTGTCSTSG